MEQLSLSLTQWVVASICTFIGVVMASGAGTGGGAMYTAIYLLALKDPHTAVPLSKITILGVGITNFIVNYRRRHPKLDRPLIHFQIAALLEPPTIIGANVGVFLNLVLPSWTILIVLVALLSLTTYKTIATGMKQFRHEQIILCSAYQSSDEQLPIDVQTVTNCTTADAERTGLLLDFSTSRRKIVSESKVASEKQGWDAEKATPSLTRLPTHFTIEPYTGYGESQTQVSDEYAITYLVLIWVFNFFALTLSGGPQAIACGGLYQKSLIVILLVILTTLSIAYITKLRQIKRRREAMGIQEPAIDMGGYAWASKERIFVYPLIALLAGACAGALGIGGGLIKGPLMINLGLHPMTAVATSLYMVLFTSTTTSLSYALGGRLLLFPSMWFFTVAVIGSQVGIWMIGHIMRKHKRSSLLTLFLGAVICASMVCLVGAAIYHKMRGENVKTLTINDACSYMKHGDTTTKHIFISEDP